MRYGAVRLLRLTGVARQRDAVLAVHQLERPLHAEALQEVWFMFLKWLFKGTSQRATPGAQESREVLPHSRSMDSDIEAAANLVARYYDPVPLVAVLAAIRAAGFVESTYFDANPDLRIHFTSTYRAMLHFLATAKCERRLFPIDLNLDGLQLVRSLCVHDVVMKTGLVAALAAAGMNMGLTPDLPRLRAIWPTALALRSLDAVPFVIVGDSHSTFYRYAAVRENKWLLPLHVCCTAGSARGLGNPNSRSGYGTQLRGLFQFIEDKAATDRMPILIQFGQVDLEFVQPFQRVKDGAQAFDAEAFRSFAVSSVRSYIEFLCDAIPRSLRPRLTVLGVFPPALSNETLRKGYVNGHIAALEGMDEVSLKSALAALEWPDCHLRTALHADYNALLGAACRVAGFSFTADFESLLGPDGTVHRRFIASHDGADHHLDLQPTSDVLAATTWRLAQS